MAKKALTNLTVLTDDALLKMRLCDLPISLKESGLQSLIDAICLELQNKGILFKPLCYLADEWFVPTHATCIGIPFYLAHSRLRSLEKKMMCEVEGGKTEDFKKLLRHEIGHALYYAFNLKKNKNIVALFGPSSDKTPDTYRPKPYSKKYVRHLPHWYAQCDADEDFAETFAVWLNPKSGWRKKYAHWGAIKKLQLVNEVMHSIKNKNPFMIRNKKMDEVHKLKLTLKKYYQKRKKESPLLLTGKFKRTV